VCSAFGLPPSTYLRDRTLLDLHVDLAVLQAYTRRRCIERGESLKEFLSQGGNKPTAENITAEVLQWLGTTS
jgi:hypothetical protein